MGKQNKAVLGRGLGALITMEEEVSTSGSSSINEIELFKIEVNRDQPRTIFDEEALEELAASIKSLGVVQPVTLRELGQERYQIISGERRYRASILAGLTAIPAYIRTASDENVMEMALIENIQREDLNSIEIALAFQSLIETHGLTQERLSERIGKKRATVANFLRLLKLPAEIQMGVKDKKIDMGHAKALLSLEDPSDQLMVYEQIIEFGFSVRKAEEIVRALNEDSKPEEKPEKKPKPVSIASEYASLKDQFSKFFETKVAFSCNDKGQGKITIPFASEQELERIVRVFDSIKK